jgi:diguanylate cyclase (GGDEF)-like protein/PAS domain S-box-containing protein
MTVMGQRISLAFGLLIFLLMLLGVSLGGTYLWQIMEQENDHLEIMLTSVLADTVGRVSFSGKYQARLMLEELAKHHAQIRYLQLVDEHGRILAHSNPAYNDQLLDSNNLALVTRVLQGKEVVRRSLQLDHDRVQEISLAWRGGYGDKPLGVIQLGFSHTYRHHVLIKGLMVLGLGFCLLLIPALLLTRAISHYFGSPVRELVGNLAATLNAMPDLLYELDREGRYLQIVAGDHTQALLPDRANTLLGRKVTDVLPPDAAQTVMASLAEAEQTGSARGQQIQRELNGQMYWFELSVVRKHQATQGPPSFIVLVRDISQRKRQEEALYLYANAWQHSGEAILITDADARVISINPALTKLTGYTLDLLQGQHPRMLASNEEGGRLLWEIWPTLSKNDFWQGEVWCRGLDGRVFPIWASVSAIRDDQGELTHHYASFTDITEYKANKDRIQKLAHQDVLTGLANRFSLDHRLEQALLSCTRNQQRLALLFIDMDHFKDINDSLGHQVGDEFLIHIANRLRGAVRNSDILARLGGDEFVVVLIDLDGDESLKIMVERILHSLGEPYEISGHRLHSSASIGASLFPDDGHNAQLLMQYADIAMYAAKEKGRNNCQWFSHEMIRATEERLALERDMRLGLERGQFKLYYQPQIDTSDWRICGVEALIRWQHPIKGMISPMVFIPLAERTGFIEVLGAWVLDEACRQQAVWLARGFDFARISINISARQLTQSGFADLIQATLDKHRLKGKDIELEVTETVAMENPAQAIGRLQELHALGVSLAIDDFGTGYSSLAYLKLLPIQTLKLDREFVRDIEVDPNDAAISSATMALAHSLGLRVVAEGVETEGQRAFLTRHQCDILQGYLFGRPEPPEVLEQDWQHGSPVLI